MELAGIRSATTLREKIYPPARRIVLDLAEIMFAIVILRPRQIAVWTVREPAGIRFATALPGKMSIIVRRIVREVVGMQCATLSLRPPPLATMIVLELAEMITATPIMKIRRIARPIVP